jgi:hypothetical protein
MALLVFVVDDYAKIHIIMAALWSLLDAKTDYVRYISHEVRTPLSATLMGLRLMLDDYQKSNPRVGSIDADRLDTLADINSSCVAALDILNDLLCFNKLEAGMLELHKEEVCPGAFVKESVAMFNVQVTTSLPFLLLLSPSDNVLTYLIVVIMFHVQARDRGVNLSVVLNKPSNGDDDDDGGGNDEGSLVSIGKKLRRASNAIVLNNILQRRGSGGNNSIRSGNGRRGTLTSICSCLLRETDVISLDKFKLDQVIIECLRKLIFSLFLSSFTSSKTRTPLKNELKNRPTKLFANNLIIPVLNTMIINKTSHCTEKTSFLIQVRLGNEAVGTLKIACNE